MILAPVLSAGAALAGQLAVTIDDLPWNSGHPAGYDRLAGTRKLVAALLERGVPTVRMVTCDRVHSDASLRIGRDAGIAMGNHTASHMDLSTRSLGDWTADASRCDAQLRAWNGTVSWFRFP